MSRFILQAYPHARINVSIVWIKMLSSDNARAARQAARLIADARAKHFYDPKGRVGKTIARSLGEPDQTAWDMYLFYAVGERWSETPPPPLAWVHQLSESWADHYRFGDDLETELARIAERLLKIEQ